MTFVLCDPGSKWLARGQGGMSISVRGEFACTGAVAGIDAETYKAPADPAEQFRLAFRNLDELLRRSDIARESIALLEVTIPDRGYRELIDPPWLEWFPDGTSRPARKTNQRRLPVGLFVQLQATCIDRPGNPLEIEGLKHRAPLPMGAARGDYVFSSVVGGEDPKDGGLGADPVSQIEQAFANCERLMQAAGGDASGINHLWVFLSDLGHNAAMLEAYLRMFPDEASRPARKTLPYALPEGCAIQIQFAGNAGGRSRNFEVPGFSHHDPIPLASLAGNLLQSSGIHGLVPGTTDIVRADAVEQAALSLRTVAALMAQAGGSIKDIAALTILLDDLAYAPRVQRTLSDTWGGTAPPAIRYAHAGLPPGMAVQFHVTAWQA